MNASALFLISPHPHPLGLALSLWILAGCYWIPVLQLRLLGQDRCPYSVQPFWKCCIDRAHTCPHLARSSSPRRSPGRHSLRFPGEWRSSSYQMPFRSRLASFIRRICLARSKCRVLAIPLFPRQLWNVYQPLRIGLYSQPGSSSPANPRNLPWDRKCLGLDTHSVNPQIAFSMLIGKAA